MKKLISSLFIVTIIMAFAACKKDKPENVVIPPVPLSITAEKTQGIKKNEQVIFNTNATSDSVSWTVNPSAGVKLNPGMRSASIQFTVAGTYVVTAKSGGQTATQSVNVVDSLSGTGADPEFTIKSLAGDEIKWSLSSDGLDSVHNVTLINVAAETKNIYGCSNYRVVDSSNDMSSLNREFYYQNLLAPTSFFCNSGSGTAKANSRVIVVKDNNVHNLTIELNGTKYNGSYVRSADGTVTFTWPYTSGVTISPLVLPK